MPERNDLNRRRRSHETPVVKVVTNAAQQEPPNASEFHTTGNRANLWLRGDEVHSLLQLFDECVRRLGSILTPLATGLADLPRGPRRKSDGKGLAHS